MGKIEQETIIRFDATPDQASVYTCDPVWLRKLEKLQASGNATINRDFGDGREYLVDKRMVVVRPRTKRSLSPEQLEASRERMKKLHTTPM